MSRTVGRANDSSEQDHILIESVCAAAYRIPTEKPESDGTLKWDSTTLVALHIKAGGKRGFGAAIEGRDAMNLIDCVAHGFSCMTQIEDGTGRKPLHLAELLAGAYEKVSKQASQEVT